VRVLRLARTRVDRARPERHGWAAIGPGLRRTYRAGRRAFAAARENPTVERLHEWRKQTKYWLNILRILEPIAPRTLKKLADQAHRLSDQLGEDHDLVVLRRRSAAQRTSLMPSTRAAALERIDRRREALQKSAITLGAIVYQHRPRNIERRLHRRWRAWRSA
jgi:CHAD domain-containing protein